MPDTTLINAVKLALRIKTNSYDEEITRLTNAAVLDLSVAGVTNNDTTDALIRTAVITYCQMHFGEPDQYDRLKTSYDEQKAQLSMHTGYTSWTGQT